MKLLMISTDRSVFDEGAPVRARFVEQAGLVDELHIIVFTPQGTKFTPLELSKNCTVYPTQSWSKFFYLPDAYQIAKKIFRKQTQTKSTSDWLITTQDPFEIGALGYLLSRRFHTPLHLQLHTDPFSLGWKSARLMNRFRFALMCFLMTKADGLRVVSLRVKQRVIALGVARNKVSRVPIFVDGAYYLNAVPSIDLHESYKAFAPIVLSMGRLEPEKNFNGLIRAFAHVQHLHEHALLVIVGSGSERERLNALARSLDLQKNVVFLPWARDVVSYYKTCDIYVQPSRYEGWGMAPIEAMTAGAPVIMTDVGCAGEIIRDGETGLIVPVGDEEALADAMTYLWETPAARKKLSFNGKNEVAKLATKEETLELYQASWMNATK